MTGATGLPLFHFFHGKPFVTWTGDIGLIMTVGAPHYAGVKLVAEFCTGPLEGNLLHRMTMVTVLLDRKRGGTFMTGPAGLASLHLLHGETFCRRAGSERR